MVSKSEAMLCYQILRKNSITNQNLPRILLGKTFTRTLTLKIRHFIKNTDLKVDFHQT